METEQTTGDGDFADIRPPVTDADLHRLRPALVRLAHRLSRCESDRDDLVQEAIVRLVEKTNWTNPLVAAHSAMHDYAKSRRAGWEEPAPFGEAEGEWNPTDDQLEALEAVGRTEWATFNWLDVDDETRRVAVLYFVDGLSQQAVAERLGVCRATVRNRIRNLKEAVRGYLEATPVGRGE